MAARTAAPADPDAAPTTPAAPELRPTSPVLAWPSEWPIPHPPEPTARTRGRSQRGVPMAPVLGAAGNATSLLATGAYEVGGAAGVAATGVVAVAAGAAAVMRRRATVRRNMASRANNRGNANWPRSGGTYRSGGGGGVRPNASPSGGRAGGSGSGRAGSGYRSPSRPGGVPSGMFGGGKAPRGGVGSGIEDRADKRLLRGPDAPKRRHKKHDKIRSQSIAAAARRTARSAVKSGSVPRKALAAVGRGTAAGAKGVGRGVRKAWTSRPARTLARKTRSGARTLHGAAVDGIRALLSAAWTGIRKRDRRAALARLKDTWARRRKNRAGKPAKNTKTTTAGASAPEVATSVRRPTVATPTPTPGGTVSGGHHFTAPAMEMARIASTYEPTGMLQVGADFAGLEEALRLFAEAMKITVENADAKQPLAPEIVEIMRGIHQLQLKAADLATELPVAFEKLHAVDLERLRNPRKGAAGERMWDVSTNLY